MSQLKKSGSKGNDIGDPRQKELEKLKQNAGRLLQSTDLQQEPFRAILRKASKTLNVRGKQFFDLVDINLSDDEPETQPARKLSGPPTSVALKRAFGIEEPRKSGQNIMDLFGDRWVEYPPPMPSEKELQAIALKNRRKVEPILSIPIEEIRRPWFAHEETQNYDPPDPCCRR